MCVCVCKGEVMDNNISCQMKVEKGEAGYVLEDVPHLTDYIPDLPVSCSYASLIWIYLVCFDSFVLFVIEMCCWIFDFLVG